MLVVCLPTKNLNVERQFLTKLCFMSSSMLTHTICLAAEELLHFLIFCHGPRCSKGSSNGVCEIYYEK